MNPIWQWIITRAHHTSNTSGRGTDPQVRTCPNCHRQQRILADRARDAVRCEGCGLPIPPGTRSQG